MWTGLGAILGDRLGWYFAPPHGTHGEAMWCFGLAGEARLVATAVEGECCLHDHDSDTDLLFDHPIDFEVWLAEHEREHDGLSRLGEVGGALGAPARGVEEGPGG